MMASARPSPVAPGVRTNAEIIAEYLEAYPDATKAELVYLLRSVEDSGDDLIPPPNPQRRREMPPPPNPPMNYRTPPMQQQSYSSPVSSRPQSQGYVDF